MKQTIGITYSEDNECLFCGKELEEHFFAGSYDTYTECKCKDAKELRRLFCASEDAQYKKKHEKKKIETYNIAAEALENLDPEDRKRLLEKYRREI